MVSGVKLVSCPLRTIKLISGEFMLLFTLSIDCRQVRFQTSIILPMNRLLLFKETINEECYIYRQLSARKAGTAISLYLA